MSPVAKYIKNIGKSVVYASIDYTQETMPATKEFVETNDELFKDTYHAITNIKQTAKKAAQMVKSTTLFTEGENAFKNSISDIKSGKLYNKEREDSSIDESYNLDDDFSMDNLDSTSASETISAGEKSIIAATSEAANQQTHATVSAMSASAKYIVNASNANANLMRVQNIQMNSTLERGFTGLNKGMENLYKFNTEVVKTLADNSKIYFEESTKTQKENNAILKEMLEMQRNTYANADTKNKNKMPDDKLSFLGVEGGIDIKEYSKIILKNIKNLASEKSFGMTDMLDKDMIKMIAANPLSAIPSLIVSTVTGPLLKTSLQKFDKTLGGVVTSFLSKMTYNANTNSFGGSLGKEILGKIFGVRTSLKTHLDTSNYDKKGPIPFDWETKKSIVEVIPGYFARIEALLSGNAPKIYDFKNGTWTNTKQIRKEFDRRKKSAISSANYDEKSEMTHILDEMKAKDTITTEQIKAMKEVIDKISSKRFEDGGWYNSKADMAEKTSRYGVNEDAITAYENLFSKISRGTRAKSAGNYLRSMNNYNRSLTREERDDTSIFKSLFSGLEGNKGIRQFSEFNNENGKLGIDLLNTKDKYSMSIFDYLRNIDTNTSIPTNMGKRRSRNNIRYADYNRSVANGSRTAAAQSDNVVNTAKGNTEQENSRTMNNININDIDMMAAAGTINERTRKSTLKKNRSWISGLVHATAEDKLKDMESSGASAEEIAAYKENMQKIIDAASEGNRFSALTDALHKLTSRPIGVLTGIIDKADEHVYNLLFEEEDKKDKDLDGKPTKGIFGKFKNAINGFSESIKGKFKEQDEDRKKELSLFQNISLIVKDMTGFDTEQTLNETKEKFKEKATSAAKGAFNDVVSTYKEATNGVKEAVDAAKKTNDEAKIDTNADGVRNVTKSGLTILSKGERVIPADQNIYNPNMLTSDRAQNRKNEKAIKSRIINTVNNSDMMADGGIKGTASQFMSSAFGIDKNTKLAFNMTQKNVEKNLPDVASSGAIGAIVASATGLGGPLVGAIAGSAVSLASNSASFQRTIFGNKIFDEAGKDTGEREGGLIGKDLQKTMGKYLPDMKRYGVTGAVLGMIGPFGPLTGVMLGSAIGFAKHNETIQDTLFGEEGIIGEDTQKVIKKAFPAATKSAIAGMLTGSAFGLGILPGAVIGAGIGIVSTTDTFRDFLLGESDDQGNRSGGVAGAIRENFVNPLKEAGKNIKDHFTDWLKDKVISPIASAVKPTAKTAGLAAKGLFNFAKKIGKKVVYSETGQNIYNTLRYSRGGRMAASAGHFVTDKAGRIAKWIPESIANDVKKFGDEQRLSHIKSGDADYMTSAERLKFMADRKKDYAMRGFDEAMKDSSEETLDKMKSIMKNIDESKTNGLEKAERRLLKEMGGRVSNTMKNTGKTSDIIKAIKSGNVKDAMRMIEKSNLSTEKKKDLIEFINDNGDNLRQASAKKANLEESRKKMFEQMDKMGFKGVNEDNYDKYKTLFNKELKGREKEKSGVSDLIDKDNPNSVLGGILNNSVSSGFATQIPILEDMANTLKAIANSGGILSAGQKKTLNDIDDRGMQFESELTHRRIKTADKKYKGLKRSFGYNDSKNNPKSKPKMSNDNKIKLLDLTDAEYKNLVDIGNSGFKIKDINTIFEMKKDVRDKWLQMAELGYEITDMKLVTTLTNKQFNKLIILAKSGIIIDDVNLALKLSEEECERVARVFMNGMTGTSSSLGVMARGGALDPDSETFKAQANALNVANSNIDINKFDGASGIKRNGNGTFNRDEHYTLNYDKNATKLDKAKIKGKRAAKSVGTFGYKTATGITKGAMNVSLNHTMGQYRFLRDNIIDGQNGGVKANADVITGVINSHKKDNIITMADGGEVKKDEQPTIVSKGERIEPAESPASVLKYNKNKIDSTKDSKKTDDTTITKSDKSTTINTEYGPQTFTRASDGSMSLPNTKENKIIQKKLEDRDDTQKELLSSIKELVITNKESLKASLANAGKKTKKGFFDTLKDIASLLNPLNLLKKFGGLFASFLGPLAPILARLGAPVLNGAMNLGSKALKWVGGKVGNIAGKAWNAFSNTKIGGKIINSKAGKIASKIGSKLGLGSTVAGAGLDDSQPDDAASAINVRGSNIESLLQQILDAINNNGGTLASSPADLLNDIPTKPGPDGKPTPKVDKNGKPVKTGGKWTNRAKKAGVVAGLALLAKNGYDMLTGDESSDANQDGPSTNKAPTSFTDEALNLGSTGLQTYSAFQTMKDVGTSDTFKNGEKAIEEKAGPILEKVKAGFRSVESGISSLIGGAGKKFGAFRKCIMKKLTTPATLTKIVERATKHAAGYTASATGVGVVVTIGLEVGFAAKAFYDGYNDADKMLHVQPENVTTGMKMLCGIVSAVLQAIPVIGWVLDPEDVIQFAIKTIGTDFGVTDSVINQVKQIGNKAKNLMGTTMQKLGEAKQKAEDMGSSAWKDIKGFGAQMYDGIKNVTGSAWDKLKGYGKSLINGASSAYSWAKDKAGSAVKSAKQIASKAYDVVANAASSAYNGAASAANYVGDKVKGTWNNLTGGSKWGRGSDTDAFNSFHSQLDPVNDMGYNAYGDTESQNMSDSGCGPASAANMASALGVPMDTKSAAQYALDNGYKEKNGGTKPGFFKDYLGKNGIDTKNINGQDNIKKQLKSGHPVLLMGTDKNNTPSKEAMGKSSTPFGTNPHYVVATGMDKNGITIQDPETNTPNMKYNTQDVLNNSSLAMAAGKGRFGKGKNKYGKGPTLDENPPFSSVASSIANKVGSSHPELFWAQMMLETGGPDKFKEDIKNHGGEDDYNYGGFTWYSGMGDDHKGYARPSNEGGYYAKFSSDEEYADAAYNKVYKSYADELKGCNNADDFAAVLKKHDYYTSDESQYAAGLNGLLNGDYKSSLGNIKSNPGASSNSKSSSKFGGIFGDLADIASTLASGFTIKKASASSPKVIQNTGNYTASQLVNISITDLTKKLTNKSISVSDFIQMASYNPNTSRDDIKNALTSVGMWDKDTEAAYNKFFKAWDDGKSNSDFSKLFDQYRAGSLNAEEFIAQADKTPAPREVILNALQTATSYDGEKMWTDSDLKKYEDYYGTKDGSKPAAKGKWGRGKSNPILKAYNEFKAGRGRKVKWGKGSVGQDIFNGLQSRGFTKAAAAGVLGNMMQESTLNPTATNEQGYHGLVQWDPNDRWPRARQWIQSEGKDPDSIDGQLDYVAQEAPGRQDSMNLTNAQSDPKTAASVWAKSFEGYTGELEQRQNYAQHAYESEGASLGGASSGNSSSKSSGRKSIFSKFKGVAEAMSKQMQAAIAPMAGVVSKGAERIFGKDVLGEVFGDENPFNSIFSSGEDDSKTGSNGNNNGSSQSTNEGIRTASDYANSRVDSTGYGNNGCTRWCQVYLEKAGNPFAKEMSLYCPTLMAQAQQKGIWKDASEPGCEGDIALLETNDNRGDGPDHAVIYDGKGGCWGNSSSYNLIKYYPNMLAAFPGGLFGYVATGDGGSGTVASQSGQARSASEAQADATGGSKWGRGRSVIQKAIRGAKGKLSNWGRSISPLIPNINKAKTPNEILRSIGNIPTTVVSSKNRITTDDSIQDAKKKAINAAREYENYTDKSTNGKGRWGRGTSDPDINSIEEAKRYIYDVPAEFIKDYNKINDDDSIIVAKQKAIKTRKMYDDALKQKGSSQIESKTAAQTIDPNSPSTTNTTDKNAASTANKLGITPDMIGPNGRIYEENDINYLLGKGYTLESARNFLSTDRKYALSNDSLKGNGEAIDYGKFAKNDVDYLLGKGYTLESAKDFLSKDKKYTTSTETKAKAESLNKPATAKTSSNANGETVDYGKFAKNDVQYLLNKGYSLEDAKALLSKDKKYASASSTTETTTGSGEYTDKFDTMISLLSSIANSLSAISGTPAPNIATASTNTSGSSDVQKQVDMKKAMSASAANNLKSKQMTDTFQSIAMAMNVLAKS